MNDSGHAQGDAGQGTNDTFDDSEIRRNHGAPYEVGIRGGIFHKRKLFVARFAAEHMVLHELKENEFYFYSSAKRAWEHGISAEVREMLAQDWQRIASDCAEKKIALAAHQPFARKPRFTIAWLGARRRIQSRRSRHPNSPTLCFVSNRPKRSCFLFSPNYYSRNVCPFAWDPNAQCPRFLDVLMRSALPDYDIDLLQRMLGSHLFGAIAPSVFLFSPAPPGEARAPWLACLNPSLVWTMSFS